MDTLFLIGPRATIYNPLIDKVLLLQRNDGNNAWEIPGGKRGDLICAVISRRR